MFRRKKKKAAPPAAAHGITSLTLHAFAGTVRVTIDGIQSYWTPNILRNNAATKLGVPGERLKLLYHGENLCKFKETLHGIPNESVINALVEEPPQGTDPRLLTKKERTGSRRMERRRDKEREITERQIGEKIEREKTMKIKAQQMGMIGTSRCYSPQPAVLGSTRAPKDSVQRTRF